MLFTEEHTFLPKRDGWQQTLDVTDRYAFFLRLVAYGRKEGNVLFNDALNTFSLRLYGVGHMVKDHSNSERGNPLPPHGLHPTDRIAYTTAFVIPVVEHWLEREIAQWVHHEGSIWRPIAPWANALTTELHLAPGGIWSRMCCCCYFYDK